MEVILQSHDKFKEIAILNLDTQDFSIHSRSDLEKQNLSTQGVFSIQDNTVVCFFRVGQSLYFRLDQTTIEFEDIDRVTIEPVSDNIFIFSIERNNQSIFSWKYKSGLTIRRMFTFISLCV